MPNHVENHLTFDCSEERLKEILQAIGRDEDSALDGQYGIGTFDFNKVIPMPDDIYRGDLGPKEQKIYGKKNWYDWSLRLRYLLYDKKQPNSHSGLQEKHQRCDLRIRLYVGRSRLYRRYTLIRHHRQASVSEKKRRHGAEESGKQ